MIWRVPARSGIRACANILTALAGSASFLDVQVISFSSFGWFVYNSAYSIRAFRLPLILHAILVYCWLFRCGQARRFQAYCPSCLHPGTLGPGRTDNAARRGTPTVKRKAPCRPAVFHEGSCQVYFNSDGYANGGLIFKQIACVSCLLSPGGVLVVGTDSPGGNASAR